MLAVLNRPYCQDFRPFTEFILSAAERFRVTDIKGVAHLLRRRASKETGQQPPHPPTLSLNIQQLLQVLPQNQFLLFLAQAF